jgi:hypothetical protein
MTVGVQGVLGGLLLLEAQLSLLDDTLLPLDIVFGLTNGRFLASGDRILAIFRGTRILLLSRKLLGGRFLSTLLHILLRLFLGLLQFFELPVLFILLFLSFILKLLALENLVYLSRLGLSLGLRTHRGLNNLLDHLLFFLIYDDLGNNLWLLQ